MSARAEARRPPWRATMARLTPRDAAPEAMLASSPSNVAAPCALLPRPTLLRSTARGNIADNAAATGASRTYDAALTRGARPRADERTGGKDHQRHGNAMSSVRPR